MNNQEFRQRAAMAALPECIRVCSDVLKSGGALAYGSLGETVSTMAVQYADALEKKLKGGEEHDSSCKIVKDLQEAKDLTSFELGLLMMLTDVSELSTIDCIKKHSTDLIATAYRQFLATYRLDEEIENGIKKRIEGIDVDKMAKDYRCFGLSYDPEQSEFERLISVYKQGVEDTINKLKEK